MKKKDPALKNAPNELVSTKPKVEEPKLSKTVEATEDDPVEEEIEEAPIVGPVPISEAEGHNRFDDVFYEEGFAGPWQVKQEGTTLRLSRKDGSALEVRVYGDQLLRIQYIPHIALEKRPSYAVDPNYQPEPARQIVWHEEEYGLAVSTARMRWSIVEKTGQWTLENQAGETLLSANPGFGHQRTILKGIHKVRLQAEVAKGDHFFGLGDKSCALDLKGQKLQNWTTDAFAYGPQSDPLYKAIPFFCKTNKKGAPVGIFLDNTYRTHFDFAHTDKKQLEVAADGGVLDFWLIGGNNLLEIVQAYTLLTGTPTLPPIWALGFHQCRWSYFPESRLLEVAQEFRDRQIPCDALYLDIDYMDGWRCFTWNYDYFPQPKEMIQGLKEQGFQTITMIDPGIKVDPDYWVFQEGMLHDVFCKRTNRELMIGPVWPQDCVWPDFTSERIREWWGQLYHELYVEQGVAGFWNDMNEPAVFKVRNFTFPEEVRHDLEGIGGEHREAHNIYGQQMAKATFDGLAHLQEDKRPFVITRATYSGGQRYSSAWTGDNVASWEHLHMANIQCQRMALSGFSFIGTDIGGFVDRPDDELFVRWVQLGVFHPLFRIHSMGNNTDGASEVDEDTVMEAMQADRMDQEPWAFGKKVEAHSKAAIEWRYELLPYLYTAFWQYQQRGVPMLRSLSLEDHTDPKCLAEENAFISGADWLVVPIVEPDLKKTKQYFPKGDWISWETGEILTGGQKHKLKVNLETIPQFLRAGACLPLYPVMQYTKEKPVEQLRLIVSVGSEAYSSELYEDAGEGWSHLRGQYSLRNFTTAPTKKGFTLDQIQMGEYETDYQTIRLEGFTSNLDIQSVEVDGTIMRVKTNKNGRWTVEVPANFKTLKGQ